MNIKCIFLGIIMIDCSQAAQNNFQPSLAQFPVYNEENIKKLASNIIDIYLDNSYNAAKRLASNKSLQDNKRALYIKSYNSIFNTTDGESFFKEPGKHELLWKLVRSSIKSVLNISSLPCDRMFKRISDSLNGLFEERKNYGNLPARLNNIYSNLSKLKISNLTQEKQRNIINSVNADFNALRHSRGRELSTYSQLIKQTEILLQELLQLPHRPLIGNKLSRLQKRIDTISKKAQSGTDQKSLNKKAKAEKKPKKVM